MVDLVCVACLLACLVAWFVGWLVGWSDSRSVGWLVRWSVGRSVGRSVGWLVGWSVFVVFVVCCLLLKKTNQFLSLFYCDLFQVENTHTHHLFGNLRGKPTPNATPKKSAGLFGSFP